VGELFKKDLLEKEAETKEQDGIQSGEDLYNQWSTAIEAADDSDLYFSPQQGNVVFASAADGWAFRYNFPTLILPICIKEFEIYKR